MDIASRLSRPPRLLTLIPALALAACAAPPPMPFDGANGAEAKDKCSGALVEWYFEH